MKIYFKIDEKSHLLYWGSTRSEATEIELEVAETHEVLKNPFIFRYENNTLTKDVAHQEWLIEEARKEREKPTQMELIEKAQSDLVFTLMMSGVI